MSTLNKLTAVSKSLLSVVLTALVLLFVNDASAQSAELTLKSASDYTTPIVVPDGEQAIITCSDYMSIENPATGIIDAGSSSTTINFTLSEFSYGASFQCAVSGLSGYLQSFLAYVYVPAGGSSSADILLVPIDASITIRFVNLLQEPISLVVPAGEAPTAYCSNWNGNSFSAPLADGMSEVSIFVAGNSGYNCDVAGLTEYQSTPTYSYVGPAESGAVNMTLNRADSSLTLNFVDTNGNPVPVPSGGYPSISCYNTTYTQNAYASLTAGDTSVLLRVNGGTAFTCQAWGFDGYNAQQGDPIEVAADSNVSANLVFAGLNSSITVEVRDSLGNLFPLPNSSAYVYLSGFGDKATGGTGGGWYYGEIAANASSVTIPVMAGDYYVNGWHPENPMSAANVSVLDGASTTAVLVVATRDAQANMRVVDQEGNILTCLENAFVGASSWEGVWDYTSAQLVDGAVTLNVIGNTSYYAWFSSSNYSGSGISCNGQTYLQSWEPLSFNVPSGQSVNVDTVLRRADATINIHVADSQGNPHTGAWVSLNEVLAEDSTSVPMYAGGSTDNNGDVSVPVMAGTFQAWAYIMSDGTTMNPAPADVTVASGATASVNLTSLSADFTLNITASAADTSITNPFYCWGYTDSGMYAWASGNAMGQSAPMALVSGVTWKIGCNSWTDTAMLVSDEVEVSPSGPGSDALDITLTVLDITPVNETFNIDSDSGGTLTADGVALDVPAGCLPDGQIDISVSNTQQSDATAGLGSDEEPLVDGTSFVISATQGGEPVELEDGCNLTLTLEIDGDALGDIDPSTLAPNLCTDGQACQEIGGSEDAPADRLQAFADLNSEAEPVTLRMTLNSFGTVAITGESAEDEGPTPTAPAAPASVTATQPTKNKTNVVLTWEASEGATSYHVIITDKKNREMLNTTTTDTTLTKKLPVRKGGYTVEVSAVNSVGESAPATTTFNVKKKKGAKKS